MKLTIPLLTTMRCLLFFLFLAAPFGFSAALGQQFADLASELGISHSMVSSDGFGAGVSFFDVDGDGWDDLTLVNEDEPIQLYLNTGGNFELVPNMPITVGYVRQAIWVDYDNDGDNDLFVTSSSQQAPLRLYQNDGSLNLTDVTMASGLSSVNPGNYGISFADYDRDGDLDFFLARYNAFGNPEDFLLHNALFRNNGNGSFTNVYANSGAFEDLAPSFMGGWIDYDSDGWPDLFVINDKPAWNNNAFRNIGGSFVRLTEQLNMAMDNDDPMSATFADFDNDGDLDFYSTNTGHADTRARLMVNQNGETFTDEAPERGVDLPAWSWGASFFDADNDGFLDLFTATGYTAGHWEPEIASVLYHNNGDYTYNALPSSHFNGNLVAASYGVAIGDVNNDGAADIAVLNAENYNSNLWVNNGNQNNYVKITLEGTVSNSMAIGAWLRIYSEGDEFVHYTRCGENYCSQNSQHHIFGLGQRSTIDSVKVWYPSGHEDLYLNVPINAHHFFIEGETLENGITASATSLCPGTTVTLTANTTEAVLWSNGSTAQSIVVNEGGTYTYTYTSPLGIQVESDAVVISSETEPQVNLVLTHPLCAADNSGVISIQSNPSPDNFSIELNGAPGGALNEGLLDGNYEVTMVSALGCVYTYNAELTAPLEIEAIVSVGQMLCFGETTQATAFVFGGVPPYTLEWSAGASSLIPAGENTLTVSDGNGCVQVFPFTAESPAEIEIDALETDGTLNISVSGGTPPYVVSGLSPDGEPFDGTSVTLGAEGIYSIVVTDGNGCTMTDEYVYSSVGANAHDFNPVRCYPNPVEHWLTVDLASINADNLLIYDASGRIVVMDEAPEPGSNRIDFSAFGRGIYLLEIHSGTQRYRQILMH